MNHGDLGTRVVDVVSQTKQDPSAADDVFSLFKCPLVFGTVNLVSEREVALVFNHNTPFIGKLRCDNVAKGRVDDQKRKRQEGERVEKASAKPS